MIQRINSLGRRRVPRSAVQIEVHDGTPRTVTAEITESELRYPADAHVVIEATSAGSSTVQRIACGTVGELKPPRQTPLDQLRGQNVIFSLKVIDRSEQIGRLLGIAEKIRPEKTGEQTVSGHRGILPVEHAVLGQQLWRLEFREHDVFLLVNRDVPGLGETVRSDPVFCSMVYPEIVRQVLTRAIVRSGDPDAEDDSWTTLWLRFGRNLHPSRAKPPTVQEEEEIDEWVEETVRAFCEQHTLRNRYVQSGGGAQE